MNQKKTWTIILVLAAVLLAIRSFTGPGMAKVFVEDQRFAFKQAGEKEVDGAMKPAFEAVAPGTEGAIEWTTESEVPPRAYYAAEAASPGQSAIHLSTSRTIGVWVAALLTLFIFSFLYRDNPLYKFAEATIVGVSAAYWGIVGFWDTLMPKLFGAIVPAIVTANFMPGLKEEYNFWILVPAALGIMLLCRLNRSVAAVSVIPLAFIVGTTSGLKFVSYVESDLLAQTASTMKPLLVAAPALATGAADGTANGLSLGLSIKQALIFVGVVSGLVYFFFSVEHKGIVGKTARVGIWYLMITFGAAFGFTVMGRIALFAARCEFIFDDWLWLIDPTEKRVVVEAAVASVNALLPVLPGVGL
ncbi:MAG: hypothetical protein O2819_04830 [Planctomycetota bacterium]|nr:hypothetical protein [Planctomycetota bacterium]MDA1105973.1 hypothetical protein [Planctomycetota bacterium]